MLKRNPQQKKRDAKTGITASLLLWFHFKRQALIAIPVFYYNKVLSNHLNAIQITPPTIERESPEGIKFNKLLTRS
jgi:hypothetical protein